MTSERDVIPLDLITTLDSTYQPESNLQAIHSGLRSVARVRLCLSRCLNRSDTSRSLWLHQFVHVESINESRQVSGTSAAAKTQSGLIGS
jgi:hypothetical protein